MNQRDSLPVEDIKKIFKDQGIEAIAAFNWTDLISNEVAFWILGEIKNQLKITFYFKRIENNDVRTNQNDG